MKIELPGGGGGSENASSSTQNNVEQATIATSTDYRPPHSTTATSTTNATISSPSKKLVSDRPRTPYYTSNKNDNSNSSSSNSATTGGTKSILRSKSPSPPTTVPNNNNLGTKDTTATKPSSYALKRTSTANKTPSLLNHNITNSLKPISSVLARASSVNSRYGNAHLRNLEFRANVERAIRDHKVFTVVGAYPAIKAALRKRGWVEKSQNLNAKSVNGGTSLSLREFESGGTAKTDEETDQAWLSRVLKDYPADLLWVIRRDNLEWRAFHKDQIVNRFPRAYFTTKVGIAAAIQNMHWYSEFGVADTFFPRCYRLGIDEEKIAFLDDFRICACMGLLKYFIHCVETQGVKSLVDSKSKVTPLCIDFAIRQLNNNVRIRRHEDIDWLLPPNYVNPHWDMFLIQYNAVVNGKSKFRVENARDMLKDKVGPAQRALERVKQYWPQYNMDGWSNVWICKPGARSRGKGIILLSNLEKILELMSHNNIRESNWVVQKYIERPMLIYDTKYDIRQWFIVTDWSPLTVWFYKESYIRFCSKPFDLDDYHESVHLCNNAVQCHYQNSETRSSALPEENMWDSYTFQAYLKTQGKMDFFPVLYNSMKQAILGILLASQETIEVRKNCFELYGADFMLSEDMKPWLIEINSCPCMAPSTSVTARMCAQCLEDTIKVVLDYRNDRHADTGQFELVYKQNSNALASPQYGSADLLIQGRKLTKDIDWPSIMTKYTSTPALRRPSIIPNTDAALARMSESTRTIPNIDAFRQGLTFMDLISRLRLKPSPHTDAMISHTRPASVRSNLSRPASAMAMSKKSLVLAPTTTTNIEPKGILLNKPDKDKASKSNGVQPVIHSKSATHEIKTSLKPNNVSSFVTDKIMETRALRNILSRGYVGPSRSSTRLQQQQQQTRAVSNTIGSRSKTGLSINSGRPSTTRKSRSRVGTAIGSNNNNPLLGNQVSAAARRLAESPLAYLMSVANSIPNPTLSELARLSHSAAHEAVIKAQDVLNRSRRSFLLNNNFSQINNKSVKSNQLIPIVAVHPLPPGKQLKTIPSSNKNNNSINNKENDSQRQ